MSNITGPFFLVRAVGTEMYETGTGLFVLPKLYTESTAKSLVKRRNKQAETDKWAPLCEMVPVTLTIGEPSRN